MAEQQRSSPGTNSWVMREYPLWVPPANCNKGNSEQHTWKTHRLVGYIVAAVTELIVYAVSHRFKLWHPVKGREPHFDLWHLQERLSSSTCCQRATANISHCFTEKKPNKQNETTSKFWSWYFYSRSWKNWSAGLFVCLCRRIPQAGVGQKPQL